MALSERPFGSSLDGSSIYLDTSGSQWVDATLGEASIRVPGGDFILEARYERLGPDLFLSGDEHSVFVKGYFTHEEAPDLYTTDGSAVILGSVATRLAGPNTPGQFAQAEAVPGIQSIGVVDNADGRVFLSRLDGSNVLAEPGTPVFLGDIVETEGGASVGITFIDDSTFALGESGRMIIDELVFDPVLATGESAFNVVKGVFSFVSGDIAETGDDAMTVNTPVLSIGVRGTTVAGRAAAEGSQNTVTLLPDASGTVGAIAVSNDAGVQVMSQPFATTTVTSQFQAPAVPVTLPAASVQDLYGDISTALPPPPASRQDDSSSDDAAAQQQATQQEEGPAEEGEAEGEEGPEGEAGPEGEGEGLEEGLEGEGEEFEEGLEEGLEGEGPEDVVPGEVREVAEEAFQQALEEGASPEEAALIAGEAAEEAFGPEGPGGREDFGARRSGGEFADVAEEAFEEALSEGLSREEAGLRARDAVEGAFVEEFGRLDPTFGVADEIGLAAGEAFLQALEEGASPEAATFFARGAARSVAQDVFGEYDAEGLEDAFGEYDVQGEGFESELLEGALSAAADQAFQQALDEGATTAEAERRAREIVIGAIDSSVGPEQPRVGIPDTFGVGQFDTGRSPTLDFDQGFFGAYEKSSPGFDLDFGPNFGPDFGPDFGSDFGPDSGLDFRPDALIDFGSDFDWGFDPNFERFVFFNPETNRLDDFALSQLRSQGVPDIVGTDTGTFTLSGNTLSVTAGEVRTSLFQIDLSGVTTIRFAGIGFQSLTLDSAASATSALTTVTGSPTGNRIDDDIFFDANGGDRDFTRTTFTDISLVEYLDENFTEKMEVSGSTDFGGASILNFQQGTGSEADIFDYTSNLKDGKNAATVSNSSDLTVVEFTSQASGRDQLSNNTSGLVEFNFDAANLAVELQINGEDGRGGGTEISILAAVESKLESTTAASNLTGNSGATGAVLNGTDGADMLLVFYEASSGISGNETLDAAIIRYQESGGDADFSGELSLVSSFEEVSDFSDANLI